MGAVQNKQMSERCKRTSERMNEWPSTLRVYSLLIRLTVQCFNLLTSSGIKAESRRSSTLPLFSAFIMIIAIDSSLLLLAIDCSLLLLLLLLFLLLLLLLHSIIPTGKRHTLVQNSQESGCKYWVTRSSVRCFVRTAHRFTCFALLATLARSAALIGWLARTLTVTHFRARGKNE